MNHLQTPRVHRLLTSPVGRALDTQSFRRLKLRTVPTEFAVARVRASADRADDVTELCRRLDIEPPTGRARSRLERKLDAHDDRRAAHERATEAWTRAFWSEDPPPMADRVEIERRRRAATGAWAKPTRAFGRLARRVEPVGYDVPAPDAVLERWGSALEDLDELYGTPLLVDVETSAVVAGPGTREYLLRFPAPSDHVDDTASARVYEPVDVEEDVPTVIFGGGLGAMNDSLTYWPEEEYLGRRLAPHGVRVVLPESPWSGRRERLGSYSGEPYLAGAPETVFQLCAAQARETALLTVWARHRGSPRVAVGGMSLGGIVTAFVIGHCGRWPAEMRPDFAFPIAFSTEIDRLLRESVLSELLGLREALDETGWTAEALAELAPLLRPGDEPGIDPERIFPFAGTDDAAAPYGLARDTLEDWGVPATNRTIRPTDHFGVYFDVLRGDEVQRRMLSTLRADG